MLGGVHERNEPGPRVLPAILRALNEEVLTELRLATTTATVMEMRGRPVRGWLRVNGDDVRSDDELARWVARGTRYARSLAGDAPEPPERARPKPI